MPRTEFVRGPQRHDLPHPRPPPARREKRGAALGASVGSGAICQFGELEASVLDSPYVFPGKAPGKPFHGLTRRFEKAVKAAKLDGVTFHTLRHSAPSHMVMAGVDLTTVKEILRHKCIATTLRYAHLSQGHRKDAVDTLASALTVEEQTQDEAKTA